MTAPGDAGPTPRTVLFDLDGTLLDTAPDMARALNRLLAEQGREALALETIRPVVSHGSIGLLRVGFALEPDDPGFETLRARFLELYQADLAVETGLFPGMAGILDGLAARGWRWGIVTNKPGWLTDPLLAATGLDARACCVVSGDSTDRRKPHPKPILQACRMAGTEPERCVYVGDAERDVQAGAAAGMATAIALYGYIDPAEDRPEDWGADALIESPDELLAWLDRRWPP